ncbi:MAG TPA: hypothetical protein VGG28_13385 [Kofleriaceae bacterium]|jgi:hypothetical protein
MRGARLDVRSSFGASSTGNVPAKLVVGISVSGFKKTPNGKEIIVDYAAFDAKTASSSRGRAR